MYSLLFALLTFACYGLYHRSKKVKFKQLDTLTVCLQKYPNILQGSIISIFLFLLLFFCYLLGLGSGIFTCILFVMTGLSLVVLLKPLAIFTWRKLTLLFLISFSLELLMHCLPQIP